MTHPTRGHARLFGSALLTVGLILAIINFPAYTLAALCILGSIAFLVGGIWLNDCRIEAEEYRKERNL